MVSIDYILTLSNHLGQQNRFERSIRSVRVLDITEDRSPYLGATWVPSTEYVVETPSGDIEIIIRHPIRGFGRVTGLFFLVGAAWPVVLVVVSFAWSRLSTGKPRALNAVAKGYEPPEGWHDSYGI